MRAVELIFFPNYSQRHEFHIRKAVFKASEKGFSGREAALLAIK